MIRIEKKTLRWTLHSLKDKTRSEEISRYGVVDVVNQMQESRPWWFEYIMRTANQGFDINCNGNGGGSKQKGQAKKRERDYEK